MLRKKNDEISNHHEAYQSLQNQLKSAEDELISAQQHFQAVSSGLSSGADGNTDTLAAQKIGELYRLIDLLMIVHYNS